MLGVNKRELKKLSQRIDGLGDDPDNKEFLKIANDLQSFIERMERAISMKSERMELAEQAKELQKLFKEKGVVE